MPKRGKKYIEALKHIEEGKLYSPEEAAELVKKTAFANFDETIEAHFRLGIDPRQADQQLRTSVSLPHGTGKTTRVLVFAAGEAEKVAQDAGADYVGNDDLVQKIQDGWLEFDAAIAVADQMSKVGGLGRILGRRGLMPNPRSGTVVREVEDLPRVINELKGGRIEFRNDRTGLLHVELGKKSFEEQQILENFLAVIDTVFREKPEGVKGIYCRSITLTSTMGPGIPVDVALAQQAIGQSASAA
ncbi:MAG: 50S ribosomal protein L1 [Sphaerobacteraceae bacterium]|nr:MAG: 50S ribosomal protein L1 [Sphaerobacteraceae bacterium]